MAVISDYSEKFSEYGQSRAKAYSRLGPPVPGAGNSRALISQSATCHSRILAWCCYTGLQRNPTPWDREALFGGECALFLGQLNTHST